MEFTKEINFNIEPIANENLAITYNGFLGNSSELSIVYGFGESWEHTSETKMEKAENGFTAQINLLNYDKLNFCFKNSNNEWDNNSYNNYICTISPAIANEVVEEAIAAEVNIEQTVPKFDIDALLDEMLQPLTIKAPEQNIDFIATTESIDLGSELTTILSEITPDNTDDAVECSTLEEILCGSVFDETPIDLFEESQQESNNAENINLTSEKTEVIANPVMNITEEPQENSLINVENRLTVSPRKLSAFYLFRKRIKLAFYKALVKIPKLIFGSQEQ